jgi:hypothetical protein
MHQGEVLFRQGTWVQRFPDNEAAATWVAHAVMVNDQTVNPARRAQVVPVPLRTAERWGTERDADVPCLNADCHELVAASVGIHFDCRG